MRLFIAFELPEQLKSEAVRILDVCHKTCSTGVKWTTCNNLHFTLQFIGETSKNQTSSISEELQDIFTGLPSFSIFNPRIEVFPPLRKGSRPRLVWARFDYESPKLEESIEKIRSMLANFTLNKDDRPFKMHLTFGRIKTVLPDEKIRAIQELNIKESNYRITNATLYESKLYAQGPQYLKINSYSLTKR